jgi:hypothetical protein
MTDFYDVDAAKERGKQLDEREDRMTPEQALGIAISHVEQRTMRGPTEPGPQTARDVEQIIASLGNLGFEIRAR